MEVISFEKFALTEEDIQGGVLGSEMASGPRSDGLHLSSVIRYMSVRAKKYKNKPEPTSWYREVGFVWEMMLESVFKHRMKHHRRDRVHQLSFERDGIHMTPDGIVFEPGVEYIEEYKATWRSMKYLGGPPDYTEFASEFHDWHVQTMGYCRAAKVNRCDFYILFINGDYQPMVPDACHIQMHYTDIEMEENWEMVLRNSKEL